MSEKEKRERRTDPTPSENERIAARFFRDFPPAYLEMDPKNGVPTWEALYHYVSKPSAERLYQLELQGYDDETVFEDTIDEDERRELRGQSYLYRRLHKDLSDDLFRMLWGGRVLARGVSSSDALGPAREIPAELWELLDLDVRNSTAIGPGITIFNIRVFPKSSKETDGNRQVRLAMPKLERWYRKRKQEADRKGIRYNREEDCLAAKAEFGDLVTRDMVREVRRKEGGAWTSPGTPKKYPGAPKK